jgi:hypothetical protein
VWLVGLEPSRIWHVHVFGAGNQHDLFALLQSRGFTTKVVHQLLNRFGTQRVKLHESTGAQLSRVSTLVSGSLMDRASVIAAIDDVKLTGIGSS